MNTESRGFLAARRARLLAGRASEGWRDGCAGDGRFERHRGGPGEGIPQEDEGIWFALARPGLLGDMLERAGEAFVSALMLLSGLILLAARANLGSSFSPGSRPSREVALRLALGSTRLNFASTADRSSDGFSGGALLGMVGAVALLHALSAWQPIPDIPINVAVDPDVRTYIGGGGFGAGERIALRDCSGGAGAAAEPVSRDKVGIAGRGG